MRIRQITMSLLVGAAILGSVSCKRFHGPPVSGMPADCLRMASVVYTEFAKTVSSGPKDDEFNKFASDPSNYLVTVIEDGNGCRYSFHLKNYRGRPVIDEGLIYKASNDGRVERTGRQ